MPRWAPDQLVPLPRGCARADEFNAQLRTALGAVRDPRAAETAH